MAESVAPEIGSKPVAPLACVSHIVTVCESLKEIFESVHKLQLEAGTLSEDTTYKTPTPEQAQLQRKANLLFASLTQYQRQAHQTTRDAKHETELAKREMDAAELYLQNLNYEKTHLESEITQCERHETAFQKIPLIPETEFNSLFPTKPEETAHDRMLLRLRHELDERISLEEKKQALVRERDEIIAANQAQMLELQQLDKELSDIVKATIPLQERLGMYVAPVAPNAAASVGSESHDKTKRKTKDDDDDD